MVIKESKKLKEYNNNTDNAELFRGCMNIIESTYGRDFKTSLENVTENVIEEFERYINDEASNFIVDEIYANGDLDIDRYLEEFDNFITFGLKENDINEYDVSYKYESKKFKESIENEYGETLYRFIVGNGTYQSDVYYAYGYDASDALDKVIDYLERIGSNNIYTFDEIENEDIYEDEYIVGGNHGVVLRHYGEFRIETPDNDDTSDGEFITENKRRIRNRKVTEARDNHTWGITYRDKSKRTKQHMVGASDAYDAKMKARKELGINFSDIDDIEMIENLDEDTDNDTTTTDKLVGILKSYLGMIKHSGRKYPEATLSDIEASIKSVLKKLGK